MSPNHADWGGERAALGRRLVGDGGTRRPDQPEGWSWTGCTAVAHQTATESSPFASPIRVIGGHLAGGRGDIKGLTLGQHGTAREEEGSARVHVQLEAHGGPRDRDYLG